MSVTSEHASIRVVLCDDARDYVAMLEAFLSAEQGVEIVGVAYDGQQALAEVAKRKPDVLVLDVSMPVMDGMAALQALADSQTTTRVVMHSGFSADDIKRRALELGAASFVEKGVNTRNLISEIRACVSTTSTSV